LNRYHVLIVDDHSEVRRTLKAGIETLKHNINVIDVPSGEEAILVLSQQKIDLLIADARLPGISGIELKKRVRTHNTNLKIFLITGVQDPKTRQDVFNAGADAYFFKPIQMAGFLEAVSMSLNLDQIPITESQEEISLGENNEPSNGIAERLSRLHQELNALYTAILSEDGQIMVQAGIFPEDASDPNILSAFMMTLNAATKVSNYLGIDVPRDFIVFSGLSSEFFLTHVGQPLGLLVIVEIPTWNDKNFWKLLSSIRSAVQDFLIILSEHEVPLVVKAIEPSITSDLAPEEEIFEESSISDFEKILSKIGTQPQAADKFWDMARENSSAEILRSDAISFEQARQLGLTPTEDEN